MLLCTDDEKRNQKLHPTIKSALSYVMNSAKIYLKQNSQLEFKLLGTLNDGAVLTGIVLKAAKEKPSRLYAKVVPRVKRESL